MIDKRIGINENKDQSATEKLGNIAEDVYNISFCNKT
jgi:hypothetical protein